MPPITSSGKQYGTGVYKIINLINGKVYIGSAAYSLSNRLKRHRSELRGNYHANKHLQAAWNEYGESNFDFVILVRVPATKCIEVEQRYIDKYEAYNREKGYNNRKIAENNLGIKVGPQSEEHIRKRFLNIRGSKRGPLSDEHKKKLSDLKRGVPKSKEHKRKIGQSNLEHLRKLSRNNAVLKKLRTIAKNATT